MSREVIAQQAKHPSRKYRIIDYPVDFKTGKKIKTLVRAELIEPYEQEERLYNIYVFKDWEKIAEKLDKDRGK